MLRCYAFWGAEDRTYWHRKYIIVACLFIDKLYELNGINFVWDEHKAQENVYKHEGITFEHAAEAFFDPFLKIIDASCINEERDAIIGMDQHWNLMFVVHIAFEEEFIRIISARKVTLQEKRSYEDWNIEKALG